MFLLQRAITIGGGTKLFGQSKMVGDVRRRLASRIGMYTLSPRTGRLDRVNL